MNPLVAAALIGGAGGVTALLLAPVAKRLSIRLAFKQQQWRHEATIKRFMGCMHTNTQEADIGSSALRIRVLQCTRCWGIKGIPGPNGTIPDGLGKWAPSMIRPSKK
jgi:hypothetical protein